MPLAKEIQEKLISFGNEQPLPGINSPETFHTFILQIIDSVRRVAYVRVIRNKSIGSIYTNASSEYFDPLKAAAWHIQHDNTNEAFWLVFLLTHFGKNKATEWALIRAVYGALGGSTFWTWERITEDFASFQNWLHQNQNELKNLGKFGNHRKYQSLDAFKPTGSGVAIGSYIEWIGTPYDHETFIARALALEINSRRLFRRLYDSMKAVVSFGRMARFDYLTMVGKLGLAPIEPDSTYMKGATGPKLGAQLLFSGNRDLHIPENELNGSLEQLESHLGLYFGMQVLEDALCNWQKSPDRYSHFTG